MKENIQSSEVKPQDSITGKVILKLFTKLFVEYCMKTKILKSWQNISTLLFIAHKDR